MVVKLKGGLDFAEFGSFAEYTCSLLAKYLDIACPEPFFVEIDTALSAGIPDSSVAERVRKSGGLNFASRYLASYSEWIPNTKLSTQEQPQPHVFSRLMRLYKTLTGERINTICYSKTIRWLLLTTNLHFHLRWQFYQNKMRGVLRKKSG